MGANGDRSTSRRSKRRGDKLLTPPEAGEMLRSARASLGIELPEVHDRTGISWRNLEALEAGDVQRFSDPAAAAVAMRRYAELVSLDPEPLVRSVTSPVLALAGAPAPGVNASWAPGPAETEASGHLRRYYGDHSHLRSFTQTAQVPSVGGWPSGQVTGTVPPSGPAGGYQAPSRRRKAPWPLRFMIWFVLFLVLVGVAGISINHYKPQWLRDIHVLRNTPKKAAAPSSNSQSQTPPTSHPRPTTPPPALVTTTRSGIGTASVKVGVVELLHKDRDLQLLLGRSSDPGNHQPHLRPDVDPGPDRQHPCHRRPGERRARSLGGRDVGSDSRKVGAGVDPASECGSLHRDLHE